VTGASEDEITHLAEELGLDSFIIDDLHQLGELPRMEELDNEIFVVAHTPSTDTSRFRMSEVDMLIRPELLLTVHPEPIPAIDQLWEGAKEAAELLSGPDVAMARILELAGRRMLTLITALDEEAARLEDLAIDGDNAVPVHLQALRRDVLLLRRTVAPQRDALRQLHQKHPLIGQQARRRNASAYYDLVRIMETLESSRSQLASVLETYRSTVAEGMNEVMKVLAVFSAIVLPLSLIAGIYGMNFANMPELGHPAGYFTVLGVMLASGIGLWVYFSRRGFIGGPRVLSVRGVGRIAGKGIAGLIHLTLAPAQAVLRVAEPIIRSVDPNNEEG
jgi:magnesium transporter